MNTAVHTESLRCVQDARHFSNPTLRSTSFRFRGVIEISCLWHEVVNRKSLVCSERIKCVSSPHQLNITE